MLNSQYLLVFIVALLLIGENQQFVIAKVPKCNISCIDESVIDLATCSCVQSNSEDVRHKRTSDNQLISKLIRDDEFATQASSDRCNNDEHWSGNACIPLISLCPGGYHWNGHACIIQSTVKTAALVLSPPDTKCPFRANHNNENDSNKQLPLTVMPIYSTSPMCPFRLVWSGDKCIRNPPSCPSGYIYRANFCHLMTSASDVTESPSLGNILEQNIRNGNKWQQKPVDSDLDVESTYGIENSAIEVNDNKMISNDQIHQHCCSIMSPRLCRRIKNGRGEQWQCFHHNSRRCTEFCTKPNIYLRPKKFSFVDPILIMPPPPRRLQKLMQNSAFRESNIGKKWHIRNNDGSIQVQLSINLIAQPATVETIIHENISF